MVRLSLLLLALSLGCGGSTRRATETPETPDRLTVLRARAEAEPRSTEVLRALLEAELTMPGGETSRARDTARALLALDAGDRWARAFGAAVDDLHARPQEALTGALAVIDTARAGDGEWDPLLAEFALDTVSSVIAAFPGLRAEARTALRGYLEAPGSLGFPAVSRMATVLGGLAAREGDNAERDWARERRACLREGWRAVGPFGPLAFRSFDESLEAVAPGPLEAQYELGEGRGEGETFEVEARGCRLPLVGSEGARPGSTVAEAFVTTEAGRHLLAVRAGSSLRVRVDGNEVLTVDRRSQISGTEHYADLDLQAGRHEIEIQFTSRQVPSAVVSLDRVGRLGEGYDPTRGLRVPEPTNALERMLVTAMFIRRGDGLRAREVFRPLASFDSAPFVLDMHSVVLRSDPFISRERVGEQTRRIHELVAERDPMYPGAALRRADAVQGGSEQSRAFADVAERFPNVPSVQLAWARVLRGQGQLRDAEVVLTALREQHPQLCPVLDALAGVYREQHRVADANALTEAQVACLPRSNVRFQRLVRQRQWDAARSELERLEGLAEDPDAYRDGRLQLALATGDQETERALLDAAEEDEPNPAAEALRGVDRALAAGRRQAAVGLLDGAFDEDPDALAPLRGLRRDLTGRGDLEAFRRDGREVIAAYEAGETQHPNATEVLVFDYMVTRIYEDGSSRNLVHQIYRIQSEEAVERYGQISLGGNILTLRSIKPDGRILEPEAIAGLNSIPMSELAIGDYVEYEYITSRSPRFNGGFQSPGWSFESARAPFAFSQMVAVVPKDSELNVESLGGSPDAVVRTEGDLKIYEWTMEHVPSRAAEPGAVPVPPFERTLRFGINATWQSLWESVHEGFLGRDHADPAASRLVRRLVGERTSPTEIARILHHWVATNIEATQGLTASAPAMLAEERGDRSRILRYMLELAGLDARLVLVRAFGGLEPGSLARPELYDGVLIQVRPASGEPFWLWADGRYARWDFIPANVRGQQGMAVLGPGAPEQVRVPERQGGDDGRVVQVAIRFDGDDAVLMVAEEYRGYGAFAWRNQLERVPAAELERVLTDSYVARMLPGAEVTALSLEGESDADAPFVLRYEARVRNFGRRQGNVRLVPPLFSNNVAGSLASLPSRTTSLGVPYTQQVIRVRVVGASGPEMPALRLQRNGLRYAFVAQNEGADFVVERTLEMGNHVVPAGEYAEFAQMVRTIAQAESAELPVQ